MKERRPTVLLPYGPWVWGSLWQVVPAVVKCWESMPSDSLRVSVAREPDAKLLRTLAERSSALVIPYGGATHGLLPFVALMRESPFLADLPMIMITNGEGARGGLFLAGHSDAIRRGDLIIPTCTAEAELISSYTGGSIAVRPAPLPVQPKFRPLGRREGREFKASLGLGEREPLLVYAGRISRQKNVHVLVQAFARVLRRYPQARLFILGAADDLGFPHFGKKDSIFYARELAFLCQKLEVDHAVHFTGSVNQETLRRFLGSADLQVSLTTHFGEDFGYSLGQGMACGAPTLVTRWGGGRDFVSAGAARGVGVSIERGLPVVSVAEAGRRISELLGPGNKREYSERALAYTERALTMNAVAARYGEFLRELGISRENRASITISSAAASFHSEKRREYSRNPESELALFKSASDRMFKKIVSAYAGQ